MTYDTGEFEVGKEADNKPESIKTNIVAEAATAKYKIENQHSLCTIWL